jgi:hypothetical protein
MVHREAEVHAADQAEYFCVATYLPLRSLMDVIPFLRLSSKVERQLHESEGAVRYGVRTNIPRKHFWTLSVWTSREAAFVEYSSRTRRLDWDEANRELQTPTLYFNRVGPGASKGG